jgi:DNA replication and repair protein RecF
VLLSLALTNFRNHKELVLNELAPLIVLLGKNGVGKTNILEAISLLAPGRGMRQAKFEDILYNNGSSVSSWSVYANLNGDLSLATGYGQGAGLRGKNQRILKVSGKAIKTQAEIISQLRVIWFSPQLEDLCLTGASIRRKYFDRLTYNFFSIHAENVLIYEKLLQNRQKILAENRHDEIWLQQIENKLADIMLKIASARLQALAIINIELDKLNDDFLKPTLELKGFIEDKLVNNLSNSEIICMVTDKLKSNRMLDFLSKRTNFGVHKSEFALYNSQKSRYAAQCSTGEQKSMLLSLVLAQASALSSNEASSGKVVLLLDEAFSHLDQHRQQQLLDILKHLKVQTWITTALDNFIKPDEIQILRIGSC